MSGPLPRWLLPDTAAVGGRRAPPHRRLRRARAGRRARHPAVRLRRGAPAGSLPRGGGRLRRRGGLRRQGVPVPGHGAARPRGGHAPRRGHRRRAARGPRRRRSRPTASCCTATTSRSTSCARRGPPASAASWSTASTSSTAWPRCTPKTGCGRRCSCGSRRASRPTPTTSSAPDRSTRSSASASRPATPRAPLPAPRTHPAVELVGVHMHIGSQVFVADFFHEAVEVVAPWVREVGLARAVHRRRARGGLRRGRGGAVDHRVGHGHRVGLPGRRHHGAGDGRAGPVDRGPGGRHALHGRHDQGRARRAHLRVRRRRHVRQPAAGALRVGLRGVPAARDRRAPRPKRVTIVGKHCESGDVLVRDAQVPDDLAVGDILATPVTGAYGHSMGSNYNKVLRPAVVFVQRGPGARGRAAGDLRRPPPPRPALNPVEAGCGRAPTMSPDD